MASDAASLLTLVNTAIETRLAGGVVEEYSIRGRSLRRATLEELQNLRRALTKEVAGITAGGFPAGYAIKSGPKP